MNRLEQRLLALKKGNRKALSLYVTAGFPHFEDTVPLIIEMSKHGADLIELGIPFSDPIADGPTIQASSEAALRNGVTLDKTLKMASEIRRSCDIPLILMGYSNPIYRFGLEKFLDACVTNGIDGTIIPDLSLEESDNYRSMAQKRNISSIYLAAPTTADDRMRRLDEVSTGFLYCVSITGVTGERKGLGPQVTEFLRRARKNVTKNPLLVGFGISTPDDAALIAKHCDGVVIGSALVNILKDSKGDKAFRKAVEFVAAMRSALDSGTH